jgi:ADP-heptose:LPS heptosyltransferase
VSVSRLGVRVVTIGRALASLASARRDPGAPVRRILLAHYLLLGDTILLAPLLKALAASHPDAAIVVLARPAFVALFDGRPYGATALPFDRRDAASQRAVIASGPYDLAIVPDDNRYAWLARAAGARRVVGFAADRPAGKNWMLDRAVAYPDAPGAWADIAATHLCDDGVVADPAAFALGEWPAPRCRDFDRPPSPYAALHVGASTPLKQWPAARWRRLADGLATQGATIVWSGGANERGVVAEVGIRDGEIDLVGRLDLAQLWHLLADAQSLLCPDTGIAHLARVVGVPTVALYGPGSRIVHGPGRFWADAPFDAVTVDDFPCRDQRTLYRRDVAWVRRCGRRYDAAALPSGASDPGACGRALCMEAIDEQAVDAAARRVITSRRSPSPPS